MNAERAAMRICFALCLVCVCASQLVVPVVNEPMPPPHSAATETVGRDPAAAPVQGATLDEPVVRAVRWTCDDTTIEFTFDGDGWKATRKETDDPAYPLQ